VRMGWVARAALPPIVPLKFYLLQITGDLVKTHLLILKMSRAAQWGLGLCISSHKPVVVFMEAGPQLYLAAPPQSPDSKLTPISQSSASASPSPAPPLNTQHTCRSRARGGPHTCNPSCLRGSSPAQLEQIVQDPISKK
jgi:hypothetical protein